MFDHHIDGTELCSKRTHKNQVRKTVIDHWDGHCAYCGELLGRSATLDHVVPKKRGGPTVIENLVACCLMCNSQKGHRDWVEFFREQDFWSPLREGMIWAWINDFNQHFG